MFSNKKRFCRHYFPELRKEKRQYIKFEIKYEQNKLNNCYYYYWVCKFK